MAQKSSHAARKKGGVWKILLVLVVLLALAVGGALLFARNEISGNGRPGAEVTVSIPQGSGVSTIAQKLKDAGVIRSAYLFRWYVGQKGAASKLQYGDFTLQKSACSYDAIIAVLSTYAKAETVRVTIPEGTTAIAIAQKMEAAGLCSAEDFLKEANEGDFSKYTFWQYVPDDADAPDRFMKCEGYLFPETYEFLKNDTVHNYVATFYAQFDAQITEEMYAELEKQAMTLPELITLASFVQEETVRTPMWRRCSATVWPMAHPIRACRATPPATSRATMTTIISGTGWHPTMAAGIRSRKISWMRMIPTAAPACLPGRFQTPALRLSRLRLPLSRMRLRRTRISLSPTSKAAITMRIP